MKTVLCLEISVVRHAVLAKPVAQENRCLCYANARSIVNKRHLLDLELSKRPFDIIVLTETHLDDSISDAEIFPENYTVFRRDRSQNGRQGGGILIATSYFLNVSPRDDLLCDSELLFVDSTPLQERLSLWEFSIDLQTVI